MGTPDTLESIKSDMKDAMKEGAKEEVATLRMLISSLNNAAIDRNGGLDEDDVVEILDKEVKKRREAVEAYREGGREERAEKEAREIDVIQHYLPDPLSEDEVDAIVEEAIETTGAEARSDMGAVMGRVMPKVKGRFEGSEVKELVLERLA